jgi:hypothetical protein
MRPLSLKRKESRSVWQILLQGIVTMDRKMKGASEADRDEYKKIRNTLIGAWKSGVLVGGVKPKRKIYDIMPEPILQEAKLADLKKESRKARAKAKREITVPNPKPAA